MAAKDPALEYIEHRLIQLEDQRKQSKARHDSELIAYAGEIEVIDAEVDAWQRLLAAHAHVNQPPVKKAAAPKK